MVTSDFTPEVEIWPFCACAMHPAIIIETFRSLWTRLWGRYHVPQNAFLVIIIIIHPRRRRCRRRYHHHHHHHQRNVVVDGIMCINVVVVVVDVYSVIQKVQDDVCRPTVSGVVPLCSSRSHRG